MDQTVTAANTSRAKTIHAWLEAGAARHPGKVFVRSIDQDREITYGDALQLARRMARYLAARGFQPNDRVALLSENSLEHLMVYFGVMYYGATICTIHVEMNATVIDDLLHQLAPKLVLREAELEGFLNELRHESAMPHTPVNGPDDVASIFYTSGTTATPKGVPCTFRDLEENVSEVMDGFGIGADDVILDYRSFNWMSAQTLSALGALSRGATLAIARKFSRTRFFEWIGETKATVIAGNPTVINVLNTAPVPFDRAAMPWVRFITSSSAPLLVQDWKSFEERYGIPIVQGYGSSETGWIAASSERVRKLGSVGQPLAYHKLSIVDPDRGALPAGEIGHVELGGRPDGLFRYVGDDGAPVIHAQGRHRTGDLGYLDADGFLFLTGRAKDLIIRGGVNISPVEVDNVLNQMSEIAEAACVGVPDSIYGEEVAAVVVCRAGTSLSAEQVIAYCQARLAGPKVPKQVHFRDSLPKTERGKLDRKALAVEFSSRN
jgi:long-chain acyl-CoA synthetase